KGVTGKNAIPVILDPKNPNYELYRGATLVKPNRVEAEEAFGQKITDRKAALDVARSLVDKWQSDYVLITLGDKGMALVGASSKEESFEVDTQARDVYDVSGAGDTVAAVLGLSWAVGATPAEAATLANLAAGVVVSHVGTVSITLEELRDAI